MKAQHYLVIPLLLMLLLASCGAPEQGPDAEAIEKRTFVLR